MRADGASGVPPNDWQRTGATIAATAVAYPLTLSAADAAKLRVTATFTVSSPPSSAFFVRAIDQGGPLLGHIVKTQITPANIGTDHQLKLESGLLRTSAVGQHTIDWKWEQSADGISGWTEFDRSTHQVFVTVRQPEAPWGRPGVPHTVVPWQEIMQLACTWAKGKKNAAAVTEAIMAAVDALAGTPIGRAGTTVKYGDLGALIGGGGKVFGVRELMLIVNRDPSAPRHLNCRDLNTAVAINATILGCPLRLIRLCPTSQDNGATIGTNPIKIFGEASAGIQSFQYHEAAAIPGPPIDNRQVFDACVRVDFDAQPQLNPPGQFKLPKGVAIHTTPADMGYRKRLLTPGSQNCLIQEVEEDGLRYPDAVPTDGPASPTPDRYFTRRREHFAAQMREVPNSDPQPGMPPDAIQSFLKSNADQVGFPRSVIVGELQAALSFTPIRPLTAEIKGVETSMVQAENRQQAVDILATLAAEYAGTLERREFGDFALHDPRSNAVLMLRGSVVAEISGEAAPDAAPSALTEASRLDDALNRFFMTPSKPI